MKYVFCPLLSLLFFVPVFAVDFPDIAGWRPDGEAKSYDTQTLWEYINGAAELFLAYDFQELRVLDIASRNTKNFIVTVSIYDQDTPLNAFGVYNTECPDASDQLAIGGGAIVLPPYQALLLKDRYYVKIDAFEGEIDQAAGEKLLQAVAEALTGTDGLPEELQWLPTKGKTDGSDGFTMKGYLGLTELTSCVHANYSAGKATYDAFIMLPESGESVDAAWDALASKWKTTKYKKNAILYREVPYKGFVGVIKTDKGLLGISGAKNEKDLGKKLLTIKN